MNRELRIKWLRGEAKGCVDVFPLNTFKKVTSHSVFAHVVEFAGGGSDFAKVTAQVKQHSATLDYARHREFNVPRDMELGRYELVFTDDTRSNLKSAAWDGALLSARDITFGTVPIGGVIPERLRPDGSPRKRGAGFGSPEQNALVEKAAIKAARHELASDGWHVRSVEAEKVGYDLDCLKEDCCLHVEVKGIRGTELAFILTARERKCAADDEDFELIVVTRALDKPVVHRIRRAELEEHFVFTPLQWRADPVKLT